MYTCVYLHIAHTHTPQMQELTGAVLKVEEELKASQQELALLKLSTAL